MHTQGDRCSRKKKQIVWIFFFPWAFHSSTLFLLLSRSNYSTEPVMLRHFLMEQAGNVKAVFRGTWENLSGKWEHLFLIQLMEKKMQMNRHLELRLCCSFSKCTYNKHDGWAEYLLGGWEWKQPGYSILPSIFSPCVNELHNIDIQHNTAQTNRVNASRWIYDFFQWGEK